MCIVYNDLINYIYQLNVFQADRSKYFKRSNLSPRLGDSDLGNVGMLLKSYVPSFNNSLYKEPVGRSAKIENPLRELFLWALLMDRYTKQF